MIIGKTAGPRKKVGQKAAHRGASRPSGQKAGLDVRDREIWRQRRTVPLSEFRVERPAPLRGRLTKTAVKKCRFVGLHNGQPIV
jgi:hypothetical protein